MNEKLKERLRPVAKVVRRVDLGCHRLLQGAFRTLGLNVFPVNDYYSPLPVMPRLKKTQPRWCKPSRMAGVAFDLDAMKQKLTHLLDKFGAEYEAQPGFAVNRKKGFGPGFTPVDALVEYMMIRESRPRRYFEVGSGLSTYYASLAAAKNAGEGHPVRIHCVEPYPYEKLRSLPGIELTQKEVQDVELEFFQQLEAGDILFLDSTHIVKVDGDVPYLILEVLPSLKKGVIVHVHDIQFPYNIPFPPEPCIYDAVWPLYGTEAMLLQAFLCHNPTYRITLSPTLLWYHDVDFLHRILPGYEFNVADPRNFCCSLWMEKVQ